MKNLIKILLVSIVVMFLAGCGDLRWNWSDNRKTIKPKLLDDEYRQSQEYKERFDVIMYRFLENWKQKVDNGKNRNL